MATLTKIQKCCTKCGSTDIYFDAFAVWDEYSQTFVLHEVYDKGHFCNDCNDSCTINDEILSSNED
jgi:alpha-D-ribose 1-methylphosphonate 5-phosphate C-P lyase